MDLLLNLLKDHIPKAIEVVQPHWPMIVLGIVLVIVFKLLLTVGGYRSGRKAATVISLENPKTPHAANERFTGKTIDFIDPRSGKSYGTEKSATPEEVNACVARAKKAQQAWGKTTFEERRLVLCDLLEAILANRHDICTASMRDTGKTLAEAHLGEIMTTLEKIRYLVAFGEDAIKPSHRRVPMAFAHRTARVDYLPLGVIGAIIPWNYPAHSCFSPTVAALFTGNAVVIKVSEFSSYSRAYLQALCQDVLEKRGHSRDLVQFLPGHGDTGAALCKCPDIAKILFIGSPQTGKRVMEACVQNLTPVILELGGKDPFVITEDAELSWAASVAIRGSFINCGQNCIASERIFVHKAVYEQFVKTVVETMKATVQGEGACDWGCMTMPLQLTKVEDLVKDAIAKGAKLLHGGHRNTQVAANGLFFEPTILTNITDDMRILHEETFGPVMLINVWENEDDLIERINKCEFGLGASVFSKNQARAERIINRIESGMGVVNDFGLPYLLQDAPFGGCKQSGFGRFNGPEGLREFCRAQSVLGELVWTPTAIKGPRLVSYPMLPVTPYAVQHMTTMFYGWGLGTKAAALLNLLKVLILGPPKDKKQ